MSWIQPYSWYFKAWSLPTHIIFLVNFIIWIINGIFQWKFSYFWIWLRFKFDKTGGPVDLDQVIVGTSVKIFSFIHVMKYGFVHYSIWVWKEFDLDRNGIWFLCGLSNFEKFKSIGYNPIISDQINEHLSSLWIYPEVFLFLIFKFKNSN